MLLRYTIMFVADVPATLAFYERAFGLKTAFLHDSNDYGQLATGDTALAFSSHRLMQELGKNPAHPDPSRPVFEIAFEVEDVSAAYAQALAEGAQAVQEPRQEPWGQTTSYVRDINNYLVEICSPIDV